VVYAKNHDQAKTVHLLGFEKAGPWVALARPMCGETVTRTAADLDQFRFEKVRATSDEMMLPGALKYGGLEALAALCAPAELFLHNSAPNAADWWLKNAYQTAKQPERLQLAADKVSADKVVDWLLR
jgi:hypothetical protein